MLLRWKNPLLVIALIMMLGGQFFVHRSMRKINDRIDQHVQETYVARATESKGTNAKDELAQARARFSNDVRSERLFGNMLFITGVILMLTIARGTGREEHPNRDNTTPVT